MTDKIEAKVTHRFAASPERVYQALVDPDLARRWNEAWLLHDGGTGALTRFEFDPQQYGRFHVAGHRNGEASDSWGTFLTLEKPTKLRYTWIVDPAEEADPSVVTIIVEPEPDGPGSVVTLYNAMGAEWAEWLPQTERGWQKMLAAVEQVLGQS